MQARIRGQILMALSNDTGGLVLSTGNKSELAVGYCTLYGDMAGGLAVIGDVAEDARLPRRARRERARRARAHPGADVHEAALGRAQARPDRPGLAAALRRPRRHPPGLRRGAAPARGDRARAATREETVRRVLRMVVASEYKRRQAAPVLKVTREGVRRGAAAPHRARVPVLSRALRALDPRDPRRRACRRRRRPRAGRQSQALTSPRCPAVPGPEDPVMHSTPCSSSCTSSPSPSGWPRRSGSPAT